MIRLSFAVPTFAALTLGLLTLTSHAQDDPQAAPPAPAARIDGTGPGWKPLGKDDFVNVNCDENTWSFPDGEIHCTGSPVGVMRTQTELTNFELVVEWRHLKSAGNSGVFLWASEESLSALKKMGCLQESRCSVLIMATRTTIASKPAKNRTGLRRTATCFQPAMPT